MPSPANRPRPGASRRVSWTTPDAGPQRQRIESASRPLLVRLNDLPRWLLLLAFVALAICGAVLPSWFGAACLVLVAAFLGWLLYLAWPSLDATKRGVRLLVLAVVLAAAVVKMVTG